MKTFLLILCAVCLLFMSEDIARIRRMQEVETLTQIARETGDTVMLNKADSILQVGLRNL